MTTKLETIAAGIAILIRSGATNLIAERDIIYVRGESTLKAIDANELKNLGWHFDEAVGSWARFV